MGERLYIHLIKVVPVEMINQVQHETNERKMDWEHKNTILTPFANKGDYTYVSVIPDEGWQKLSIVRGNDVGCYHLSHYYSHLNILFIFTHNYSRRINHIVQLYAKWKKEI